MSVRQKPYHECVCDSCQQMHPAPGPSREEVIAKAYIDGWRFPPERKRDGTDGARSAAVCPDCLPTFEGKLAPDTGRTRRRQEAE